MVSVQLSQICGENTEETLDTVHVGREDCCFFYPFQLCLCHTEINWSVIIVKKKKKLGPNTQHQSITLFHSIKSIHHPSTQGVPAGGDSVK